MQYKNIFCFSLLLSGCSSLPNVDVPDINLPEINLPDISVPKTHKPKRAYRQNISGPFGTEISPIYNNDLELTGFKAKIAENIGVSRTKTEYAQICYDLNINDSISWQFQNLTGTKNFRTPIDLVTLSYDGQMVFKQRHQDDTSWNEHMISKDILPVDLYLDRQKVSYQLQAQKETISFNVQNQDYSFTIPAYKNLELCLGLKRSELLRWTGSVVPAQSLDIIIEKTEQ